MEENKLVPKKLGFFQRIRKAFYLRGMNAKKANKYYSLPSSLYLTISSRIVKYYRKLCGKFVMFAQIPSIFDH